MISIDALIREGRDAVIAERLLGTGPAANPYTPTSKRGRWWQRGAEMTGPVVDNLMRIGS